MRLAPWASFWQHSQYAELPNADLSQLPHELDPYERFVIRWLFSGLKVALLVPAGIAFGWLFSWATGVPF